MIEIRKIIKDWKVFYIIFYLLGHFVSLIKTGVPNITYLFPPNLLGVLSGFVLGNAIYYASKGFLAYSMIFKIIKYVLISIIIMIFYRILGSILMTIGVDISVLYGLK